MSAKRLLVTSLAVMAMLGCNALKGSASNEVKLETEDQKLLYSLGLALSSNSLGAFKGTFSAEEMETIKAGFGDGLQKVEPKVALNEFGPKLQGFLQKRMAVVSEGQKTAGKAYLDKAAAEPGAVKTASGVVYKEVTPGTGASPSATSKVKVHYEGSLIDGKVFDSSIKRGEPISFPLNGVIKGWQEGLQMMKVGGKAKLVIPPELAYGDQEVGEIPPGSTLVFEVELLAIE